jgi:hypothetical protein
VGTQLGSNKASINILGEFCRFHLLPVLLWKQGWDHKKQLDIPLLRDHRHCELLSLLLHGYLKIIILKLEDDMRVSFYNNRWTRKPEGGFGSIF